MAASFPNAKKTFSAVVNGITKLIALLFNSNYDEIEAIETMLGAMGSTQVNTESYKNLLKDFYSGCDVAYKGVADLYVRAGAIAIPDALGNLRFRKNTSDTIVTWSDIDTGLEAGSTKYYVYAVADAAGTTFTVKISINATTPSGSTFYRLIGIFYNDASSNIINPVSTLSVPTGSVVQVVHQKFSNLASGSANIPQDDSIPQNTEGDEYMTLTITPKSASNKLRIDVSFFAILSSGTSGSVALFRDSAADAIGAALGDQYMTVSFSVIVDAVSINPTTFKIRAGCTAGQTTYFNGYGITRYYGGVCASSITITEIKA